MTRYEKGFLAKCAEYGLPYENAIGLFKSAKVTGLMSDGRVVTIDHGKKTVGGGRPMPSSGAGFVYTGKSDPRTVASGGGRYRYAPASSQPGAKLAKRQPDGKGGYRMSEPEWRKTYGNTKRPNLPQSEIDRIHAKNVSAMRSDPDYIAWSNRVDRGVREDRLRAAREMNEMAEKLLAARAAARSRGGRS
jgi:hypothetical protein